MFQIIFIGHISFMQISYIIWYIKIKYLVELAKNIWLIIISLENRGYYYCHFVNRPHCLCVQTIFLFRFSFFAFTFCLFWKIKTIALFSVVLYNFKVVDIWCFLYPKMTSKCWLFYFIVCFQKYLMHHILITCPSTLLVVDLVDVELTLM